MGIFMKERFFLFCFEATEDLGIFVTLILICGFLITTFTYSPFLQCIYEVYRMSSKVYRSFWVSFFFLAHFKG